MMKVEFEQHINARISQEDYAIVEHVYMWHPAIPNVGGKDKIANLYLIGGMDVIRDMNRRAVEIEEEYDKLCSREKEISEIVKGLRSRVDQIDEEIERLKAEKDRRETERRRLCGELKEIRNKKEEMI